MADRRSVFTEEVVQRAASFACAADEVWRLQRGSEEDCVLFQRWSNGGKRITDGGTRQGFWVFSPGGKVLGRINSRSPERVGAMLDAALERWSELPKAERQLDPEADRPPAHRWEDGFPEGGLALSRISRDLSPEGLSASPSNRWNRDTVWCSKEEVKAMLPDRADVLLGSAGPEGIDLQPLADRLAQFALVDDARGQTLPYAPAEIEYARLVGRVVEVNGLKVTVELSGSTKARSADTWLLGDNNWTPRRRIPHGIECELLGSATLNLEEGSFEAIELMAVGTRWGRTTFNGRGKDLGPSPIGFHLTLTEDRLAPTFASLYGVDWIPRPEVPTWRDSPAESGLERR